MKDVILFKLTYCPHCKLAPVSYTHLTLPTT